MRIEPVSAARGGVEGRAAQTQDPGPVVLDSDGTERRLSNTNLATEQVAQVTATRAFAANVAVARTADEMDRELLDLKA